MGLRFQTDKILPKRRKGLPAVRSVASRRRNPIASYDFWRVLWLIVLVGTFWVYCGIAAYGSPDNPTAVSHHQPGSRSFARDLERVQPFVSRYGYAAAALAVFAEGMGIPLPGQTLLIATALEASVGRLSITLTLVIVFLAAALGNSVGYAIGRWGGRTVLNKLRVNAERQKQLDGFFKQRGGPVILIARFIDGLRQLNGIVTGVARMPWWTFTAYNIAGAALWTSTWGLGAFYLGHDIHRIAGAVERHRIALFVVAGAALVALLIYLLRRNKDSKGTG